MHLPTLTRKAVFLASGRLQLSDAVRNRVYTWAWGHLKILPADATIVDIGSRDSLFPAFLAWRRYRVRVIERDARFIEKQQRNARRWRVKVTLDNCDFLEAGLPEDVDAVCSLFSLQHAGENDTAGYRKAARLFKQGGMFLSATEYCHDGTRFHHGRDDGSMRIYGPEDINSRIIAPLTEEGMVVVDRQYLSVTTGGKVRAVKAMPERASIMLLLFKKAAAAMVAM